ncbi:hypothetical protein [Bradyrhizobium glycinis]|uniref:hypothetical protein n=1 Tax=Bradyrhizobium glycinis TaxID=2751812 RepID=UPI0018D907C5|nr:hypothetical protein [Bradyrhizobium glycinis]
MKTLHLIPLLSLLLVAVSEAQPANPPLQGCTSGVSRDQQRQCDQQASEQLTKSSRMTTLEGGWRLVRTKNPSGGPDAVSVMHVADSSTSDLRLAGVNLQCGKRGVEVILVTVQRGSIGDRPRVALSTTDGRREFEGTVIQSGEALLLPQAATDLAAHDWQNTPQLSVEIEARPDPIRGVIPLLGLGAAMKALVASCAAINP